MTVKQKILMIFWQIVAAIGLIGVGAILSTSFFFTEAEFWANVARFWK